MTGYDAAGSELAAGEPACVAKSSFNPDTKRTRFWVKAATYGRESGSFFNPCEHSLGGRGNSRTSRPEFDWRTVTPAAFDMYIKFLRSGNPAHLRQAERENG